jgi:hypothetical protein
MATKLKTGPKPTLTDEVIRKIKTCVIERKNMKEIATELEIPYNTLTSWKADNYLNIADKWQNWNRERMLKESEEVLDRLKHSESEEIAYKSSSFLAETLGKKWYSKRAYSDNEAKLPVPILLNINISGDKATVHEHTPKDLIE